MMRERNGIVPVIIAFGGRAQKGGDGDVLDVSGVGLHF